MCRNGLIHLPVNYCFRWSSAMEAPPSYHMKFLMRNSNKFDCYKITLAFVPLCETLHIRQSRHTFLSFLGLAPTNVTTTESPWKRDSTSKWLVSIQCINYFLSKVPCKTVFNLILICCADSIVLGCTGLACTLWVQRFVGLIPYRVKN
jgi:hypothetical protein